MGMPYLVYPARFGGYVTRERTPDRNWLATPESIRKNPKNLPPLLFKPIGNTAYCKKMPKE
jgi:hypothetical protein